MICAWARAFRSIVSSASPMVAASGGRDRSTRVQPMIAVSGVRSSCETVARNSSLARLASWAVR